MRVYARSDMLGYPAEVLLELRRMPGATFACWEPNSANDLQDVMDMDVDVDLAVAAGPIEINESTEEESSSSSSSEKSSYEGKKSKSKNDDQNKKKQKSHNESILSFKKAFAEKKKKVLPRVVLRSGEGTKKTTLKIAPTIESNFPNFPQSDYFSEDLEDIVTGTDQQDHLDDELFDLLTRKAYWDEPFVVPETNNVKVSDDDADDDDEDDDDEGDDDDEEDDQA